MPLWKLTPSANPTDPHWKGYRYRDPLFVVAEKETDARLKATEWYKATYQGDPDLIINQLYRSAFSDEKLYQAREVASDALSPEERTYPLVK